MTRDGSETRQPVPEEDSGPPRPHTPSPVEDVEANEETAAPSKDKNASQRKRRTAPPKTTE